MAAVGDTKYISGGSPTQPPDRPRKSACFVGEQTARTKVCLSGSKWCEILEAGLHR